MENSVVLIGSGPLFGKVKDTLNDYGVNVIPFAAFTLGDVRAVIDVESGMTETKKEHLVQVERLVASTVPVFTSTLHRTATEIASWMKHPERVVGFSPLLLKEMHIVEVSCPLQADQDPTWKQNLLFWTELGKTAEVVGDEPGLVFPRTLALLVNEATFALSERIASAEDIDLAMKKGTNFPFGPLEWADAIGIDQVLAILTGLYREMGEERYRPAPLLKKMMYAGYLGQASGRGFYQYE
ncbi:3-hydroxyacyl-CoA dehydrogenase family protein [Paenactinomyces guangxiensis]|uniref:3-hydroxybutyryl-CoA dehydrogenase n=1 Tax=Paenactinomyces guangxiensis TaxID=1490290 RepID=A0A7W1WP89_9BACL|nr:3-hydroxyacyl-CoA dehydrogenase family protein [Paenactinomyces guangxiensis]MBA4493409.1 3-hydroxybutyryl-CoA dehydrogenase [Paenactinomyces guangxiensis]MBH8590500.1 3-hydroxybutyryl-CoA dehydrogenase [Paenactinomyces guangxiensis]